jgi:serine/threonine protein kinase
LHKCGYVHNDIKPDNITVGDKDNSPQSLDDIRLIDFGLATEIDKTNQTEKINFMGTMAYSSLTSMNKKVTSQRDDLMSLVYVMLHLHKGNLSFYGLNSNDNP